VCPKQVACQSAPGLFFRQGKQRRAGKGAARSEVSPPFWRAAKEVRRGQEGQIEKSQEADQEGEEDDEGGQKGDEKSKKENEESEERAEWSKFQGGQAGCAADFAIFFVAGRASSTLKKEPRRRGVTGGAQSIIGG